MKGSISRVFDWIRRHTVAVALALLLWTLITPIQVQGQLSPCCIVLSTGLGTINTTLNRVIGGALSVIYDVLAEIERVEREVVWPAEAIVQARAVVGAIQSIYALIRDIFNLAISSATLPNPKQLESILLSRNPAQIGNTPAGYRAVYGEVPLEGNASPEVRDLIDMTDAVAQDAMARAIAVDAIADQELQAADQINASIQSAAPGSAPIIEAQAGAWLLRAHAYTQSALADLMRVRAIDLANSGATMKFGSAGAVVTQQNVDTMLKRK